MKPKKKDSTKKEKGEERRYKTKTKKAEIVFI